MFGLFRSGRHLARLVRIGLTLARHDALFPLDPIAGTAPFLRIARLFRRGEPAGRRPGERLAAALTELGPSFIKLGQILSTRADLLGDEITEDLALLQDRERSVPADSSAQSSVPGEHALRSAYISWLASTITTDLSQLHVVVDCANGAATAEAPELFRACRLQPRFIHAAPDGIEARRSQRSKRIVG